MDITVNNNQILPIAPSVGIFWGISDNPDALHLLCDGTPLAAAEIYGQFITHPHGHYEMWEAWQRLGPAELKHRRLPTTIAWSEYESHPRGRLNYETLTKTFILYADRQLQNPPIIERLIQAFGLRGQQILVRSDDHYRI